MVKLKTPKTIFPIIIATKLIIQVTNSVNNVKTTKKSIKILIFFKDFVGVLIHNANIPLNVFTGVAIRFSFVHFWNIEKKKIKQL
jgi:hypothetical protein